MLEKVIDNLRVQTYTYLLSIPSIASIIDGSTGMIEGLSVNNVLETAAGVCLFGFVRGSYRRQKKRYGIFSVIYGVNHNPNSLGNYVKSTICERRVSETVIRRNNGDWKELSKKYPWFKVVVKQIK